ncbi:Mbeg1-like protein [Ottowia testudinis]|uniref:DUF2974 domain-containing protein n=1 Tax=Ottowia testudinis TaxID=2816950 RepID=A0A975CIH0_9BURK|nr:DUF2974 domain-containing protein [Ottowia testudinis]QTD45701.1 DUF2974 domain-containing protein [Ottowia testudinis]
MAGAAVVGGYGFGFQARFQPARAASASPPWADTPRGYPVGDGSFAASVRGTQPQPERDLHFAMMANDAYALNSAGATGTQSERELAQAGWTRLAPLGDHLVDAQGHRIPIDPELLHDPKTGFDAAIYQNGQGQYVLAFRGTDSWSLGPGGDATTNGGQGLGLSTDQYRQAVEFATRADGVFGTGNIAITGHSLGGGLASAAMLATGAPGATFNAAGLSDNTLRALGFASPNAVRADLASNGQIRRYNVAGELLTGIQQGTPLPDAVGHELRVAPPARGGRHPITLHGGGGNGASYVEALREHKARRPGEPPALLRTAEHVGESQLKLMAAAGTHAWGAGAGVASAAAQTAREIGGAAREDLASGRLALGAGRVARSLASGVANAGATLVQRAGDLAGDVVMEHSTLAGNVLRGAGRAAGLAQPLGAVAEAIENAGYRANQTLDAQGAAAGHVLNQAGHAAQQTLGALGAGAQWAAERAADGMTWAGQQIVTGAQWAAEKTVAVLRWSGQQAVAGAQWVGEKTVARAQWAVDQAAAGGRWVGERATDAGRWMGRHLNPAHWF